MYPSLCRKLPNPPDYRRERLTTPDDDFLDLDFCGTGTQPLVILLHGLTGSSQSGYIKGLQHRLIALGLRSVAVNFRGCSGQPNNRARCYHSGETEDIQHIYQVLRQREPHTPMAAIGFSLGGNVLLKWLGEQQNQLDLFAAVAVSVPMLLNICATRLDSGFSKLYCLKLLNELKSYMNNKLRHLNAIEHTSDAEKITALGDLSAIDSFWQYDDIVVAQLHGFEDVHDYYRRSSSRQYLQSIHVTTLIIQSGDDPFMSLEVLPAINEMSSSVQLEVSTHGGHVGFVSGQNPLKPTYWLEQRIPEFLLSNLATL
jgi:predicted alpha/beta-fold hydrolase